MLNLKLKKSQYNYVMTLENDGGLIFNGVSKAIGQFTPEQFEVVKAILASPDLPVSHYPKGLAIKSYLIRNGFLISSKTDEVELLHHRNHIGRTAENIFDLLILPTLDCNFRCFYCYEEHRPVYMSQHVEQSIKRWADKNLIQYSGVNLSWFGGEPLLKMDTILRLSAFFQKFCIQHKKRFTNMITTNGYLLNSKTIDQLNVVGLKHFHITIDGSPKWHNQFRKHKNGKETFDRIVKGVQMVLDQIQDAKVTIRVNYNKKNFEDIPQLFNIFPFEHRNRISLILRQIFGRASDPAPLPGKSRRELEYYSMAAKQGYCLSLYEAFQGPKETYCYADKTGALIIGPEAELFKCGVGTFDSTQKTGDLRCDGSIQWNKERLDRWEKIDGFRDPECIKCRYLPLCMGGCRANRLKGKRNSECTQPYEMLEEILKISISQMVAK